MNEQHTRDASPERTTSSRQTTVKILFTLGGVNIPDDHVDFVIDKAEEDLQAPEFLKMIDSKSRPYLRLVESKSMRKTRNVHFTFKFVVTSSDEERTLCVKESKHKKFKLKLLDAVNVWLDSFCYWQNKFTRIQLRNELFLTTK